MSIPHRFRSVTDAAGAVIDSIKLNTITRGRYRGRPVIIKQRRLGSEQIAGLANIFFKAANAGISICADPKQWQDWEVYCYETLNGDQFRIFARDSRTLCQEKIPGKPLRDLLKARTLTPRALEAAAQEIRRAHRFPCPQLGGLWSHSDLHMGNVLYDAATNRARLIDFEIIHDKSLPALSRHADDLLVFLQDMVGPVSEKDWLPFALIFLRAYGRPRIIGKLRTLLVIPGGLAGMWWTIRANHCDGPTLRRRVQGLRRALDAWARSSSRPARRAKTRRRGRPSLASLVR